MERVIRRLLARAGQVVLISSVLIATFAAAALADQVINDTDDTPDASFETITLNTGDTKVVRYRIEAQNNDSDAGCNIDANETQVFAVSSSEPSVATVEPGSLTFTGCSGNFSGQPQVTVTANQPGTTNIALAVPVNTAGGNYSLTLATVKVTVNTPPTVAITDGPANVDEGSTERTYRFRVTDPDSGDDFVVRNSYPRCGNDGTLVEGSLTKTANGGTFKCVFDDGPGNSTVQISVRDTSGNAVSNVAERDVNVRNVAPTADFAAAPPTINEGGTTTVTFTNQDDPSQGDTDAGFRYEYACDGTFEDASSYATASEDASFDCTYDQDGEQTIAGRIIDKDDGSTTKTATVTVNNVAPAIQTFTAEPNPADEGEDVTLTATATDPGDDDLTYAFDCDLDAEGGYVENEDNTATCTYGNEGTYTAGVQVTDGDEGTATKEVEITVENVPPTVALTGPANADEGDVVTYDYTINDPGDEAFTPDTRCGTGGEKVPGSDEYDDATGEGSFDCEFPDGPANPEVSVTIDDGKEANDSIVVQVRNLAPEFELSGDATADEGQTKSYTYTVDDPGGDEVTNIQESCGVNATYTDTTAENSFDCTFIDGGEGKFSNVSVSGTDSDGANGGDDLRVDVANVKPGVLLAGPVTANEGETKTYTFTVTDPGTTDTHTAVAACGDDGELVADSLTYSQQTREGSFRCFFPNGDETTTVTVRVTDSDGAQDTDNRFVEVTIDNVAPAISEIGDQTIEEDGTTGPISFTVTDVDEDTITITAASSNQDLVQDSDITLGGEGENRTVTVTPDADESGQTTITITTTDDSNERSTEEFTVTVTAVNDAPVADDDSQTVAEDGENATFDLGALVSDRETADADIEYAIVTGPTTEQGTASISGQTLTFDPSNDFNGTVTITYSATDDGDGTAEPKSDNGTLTINVTAGNEGPVAVDDTKSGAVAGEPLTFPSSDLTANDTDADNDGLTVTNVGNAQNGTVSLDNGQVTFTGTNPGPASFDYTVSDGNGGTDTGTVSLTVGAAPPANADPNAVNDSATTNEDTAKAIDVLGNDNDADDDTLTITTVSNPANGTAQVVNGRIRYTPDADYSGTDTFTYTVSDGNGGTDTATVTVRVTAVNDAPVARNDSAETNVNRAVNINVLANDSDIDGGNLRVTNITQPSRGTVRRNDNGTLRFTPDRNFTGTTRFTYTVSDGRGGTDIAAVNITVRR